LTLLRVEKYSLSLLLERLRQLIGFLLAIAHPGTGEIAGSTLGKTSGVLIKGTRFI